MACVIERVGEIICPSTHENAERIVGRRLDRRRNYAIIDGKVCQYISWTQQCSGCSADCEEERGCGCEECGYHGRVRESMWLPLEYTKGPTGD